MKKISDKKFNEVVNDFMNKLSEIHYEDKEKKVLQIEMLINIFHFIEGQENYMDNCNILEKKYSNQNVKQKTKLRKK